MTHPRVEVGMYVLAKTPLAQVEASVSAAKDQQLDSIFIWDHIQDFIPSTIWDEELTWLASLSDSPHEWFEFQALLGYFAGRYPGLRLGVGVTEPVRRHPVILAQAAITLAHLSQHAPILGIGMGERVGAEPLGLNFSRTVGRLEEALQIIRRCFDSQGPIDFDGEHFQLRGAVLDLPVPVDRKPEIWVAAHGPRMLRMTGQYGDGWYPFLLASPEDYAARLEVIRGAAREAGRDPDAITPALHPLVVVAPTEDEARAMLDSKWVRFWALILPDVVWQAFGLEHPLQDPVRGYMDFLPETYTRDQIDAAIDAVPPGMMEGLYWGTPEQVIAKLRAYAEAGMRHVVPIVISPAISPEAATYSAEVMPQISHALRSGE